MLTCGYRSDPGRGAGRVVAEFDLEVQANNLRVDRVAVEASRCLTEAGVPHAVIKGPTTSLWLYDPPRAYADVDLLVPQSRLGEAIEALRLGGVAEGSAGGSMHEISHSVELRTPAGFEIDLHRSLPSLPAAGDRVWSALAPHVVDFDLGADVIPALDEAGRCLVIAFHALSGGGDLSRRWDDLTLAHARIEGSFWDQARLLAGALDAADLFDAALTRVGVAPAQPLSRRGRLALHDALAEVVTLDRLATTPWREVPSFLLRELWPSREFIRRSYPELGGRRFGVIGARIRRWFRLGRALPSTLRALRDAT